MPRKKTDTPFRYSGFPSPNGTVVPDDVFDVLAPLLSEAELRVLLYIIRRTFGFKKEADSISLSQMVDGVTTRDGRVLDSGTGMSRRGVMKGCAGLVEKGIIRVDKRLSEQGDNEINVYHLHFRGDSEAVGTSDTEVGNVVPYGRERRSPGVGNNVAPQQTVKQQTDRHISNIRNNLQDTTPTRPPERTRGERSAPASAASIIKTLPLGEVIADRQRQRKSQVIETHEPDREEAKQAATQRSSNAPIASGRGRLRRVAHQDEAYQVIQAYIADFSRELNDKAPLKTSTTRAYNLYKRSGLDQEGFIVQLYAARAVVKERAANIRSRGEDSAAGLPMKHKAAYYFAVLEDLLGLRQEIEEPMNNTSSNAPPRLSTSSRTAPTSEETDGTLRSGWSKQRT